MKKNLIKIIAMILCSVCFFGMMACNQDEEGGTTGGNLPLNGSSTESNFSYYIKLDGIEGESTNSGHVKWIDVIDFSCGTETTNGEATYMPVTFTHKIDKATPKIHKNCLMGNKISSVEFNAVENVLATQVLKLKIIFTDVKFVDFEGQTVTDSEGSSYLIEKVTMFVSGETITTPNEANNSGGRGFNYYLKLDGIEGETSNSSHAKWIDITTFSYGGEQTTYTDMPFFGINGAFKPIVFNHKIDKATPLLQQKCKMGNVLDGEFNATKSTAGRETLIYKIVFDNLKLVKAVIKTVTTESGNSYLVEEITMVAEKETWTYNQIGLDNSVGGSTEENFDQTKRA